MIVFKMIPNKELDDLTVDKDFVLLVCMFSVFFITKEPGYLKIFVFNGKIYKD